MNGDYDRALWHPIHFKPAIDDATDEQCLSCHQEILDRRVLAQSPAGVKSSEALAWYQTLYTYAGEQETLHRRHLVTPLATQLMSMKCNTCHQGNDPREEAPIPPDESNTDFTLRKAVNPEICLMCHGANPYQLMGLPRPWPESRSLFQDNCLLCHANIRTTRHQVNFCKRTPSRKRGSKTRMSAMAAMAVVSGIRIPYPYPRHAWKGMTETIPDWAKDRPTESKTRFQITTTQAAKAD